MTGNDPLERVDYRRFVAWKARIERELPFLREIFGRPGLPILDVGCATGEHSAALAAEGHAVVGLDLSESLIRQAREAHDRPRFVRGDMTALPFRGEGILGGALSVGNTLAYPLGDDRHLALFAALRRHLAPGAPFLIQILNYHRIREKGIRHLPLNFRKTEGGEALYLRILDPIDDDRIRFEMLTLERRPDQGETRIVDRTETVHRSLRHGELVGFLREAGFGEVELFGNYGGDPYEPLESPDVIVVARAPE
ncbi:MAG: methyltransferase domain-containing protein [Candidatus Eisenbacteria bacterium]